MLPTIIPQCRDDEYRSDEVDLPKTLKVISNYKKEDSSHFLPQHDEDYDYDCPYWSPSNMEQELIAQFRKLRIAYL